MLPSPVEAVANPLPKHKASVIWLVDFSCVTVTKAEAVADPT